MSLIPRLLAVLVLATVLIHLVFAEQETQQADSHRPPAQTIRRYHLNISYQGKRREEGREKQQWREE